MQFGWYKSLGRGREHYRGILKTNEAGQKHERVEETGRNKGKSFKTG